MAALVTQEIDLDGEVMDLAAAAAGGDTIEPRDGIVLAVKNTHATLPRTVTPDSIVPSDQGTDVNPAIVVAAQTTVLIAFRDSDRFRNGTTGRIGVSYSDAAADLTVGAFIVG